LYSQSFYFGELTSSLRTHQCWLTSSESALLLLLQVSLVTWFTHSNALSHQMK